jgi:hypothetical protein
MNAQIDMEQLAAQVCGVKPRFEKTSCSQCGRDTGPGDAGHSSCATHGPAAVAPDLTGMYSYEYVTSLGLCLRCCLDYEPSEKATQSEPGCTASMELVYAFAGLIDISEVLSDDVKALIESEAMESMKMDKWNDDYDRGEERHLDRMAA